MTNQLFPQQPGDKEGPVFNAPWEAQAFSLVLALHEQGLFTWEEWTSELSQAIGRAQTSGDPDLGNTYYRHWLYALEKLVTLKGLSDYQEIEERMANWRKAYRNTPHGSPVDLSANKK
jgi:nitrile hydratase accessory protein